MLSGAFLWAAIRGKDIELTRASVRNVGEDYGLVFMLFLAMGMTFDALARRNAADLGIAVSAFAFFLYLAISKRAAESDGSPSF
jgi:hypothetical protein